MSLLSCLGTAGKVEKESPFHMKTIPVIMNQDNLKVLFLQEQENKNLCILFLKSSTPPKEKPYPP